MQFPKKTVDELNTEVTRCSVTSCEQQFCLKEVADLITYAELANARIKELENDCSGLMFKLRCVAQALK